MQHYYICLNVRQPPLGLVFQKNTRTEHVHSPPSSATVMQE